jgi:CubicO group peptidase (beta-lactamase class C family)
MASPRRRTWRAAAILIALAATLGSGCRPRNGVLRSDYNRLARAMTPIIEREMAEKGLPSFAIAFVDDKEIVWSQGFGYSDLAKTKPATLNTATDNNPHESAGSINIQFNSFANK